MSNQAKEPGVQPTAPTVKIDWKQRVAASGGAQVFLPEKFLEDAKKIEALRIAFNDLIKGVAEKEITMNMETQTMLFSVRKFLAENGRDDIWTKEIGMDGMAIRDGEFVINIRENQR